MSRFIAKIRGVINAPSGKRSFNDETALKFGDRSSRGSSGCDGSERMCWRDCIISCGSWGTKGESLWAIK